MKLAWKDLVVGYQKSQPLNLPFSGEIKEPGIYVIVGPNGTGKSALLKTFLGLLKPLDGVTKISQPTSYVPQFSSTNPYFHLSVRDFVAQGQREEKLKAIKTLLQEWQLSGVAEKEVHTLSGGQKTRAMIARALLRKSSFLLLDEPLASLDPCCQRDLMEVLFSLAQHTCVLMVEHHIEKYEEKIKGRFILERRHNDNRCTVIWD